MIDIVERLELIANLKPGSPVPDNFGPDWDVGNWAVGVSKMCQDAAEEIKRLRATVFGQNARLDQLQSIVGCAMNEPLITFNDIKKAIPTMKGNGQ